MIPLPTASARTETAVRPVRPELVDALRSLAGEHDTTLATVLRAALAVLWDRLGEDADAALGTRTADRGPGERTDVFAALRVPRACLAHHRAFTHVLDAAHATRENPPQDDTTTAPPAPAAPGAAGHPLVRVGLTGRADHRSLHVSFVSDAGEDTLEARIAYAPDHLPAASADRLATRLVGVLAQITANPAVHVAAIDVLTDQERRHLLQEPPATGAPARNATIPQLVRRQVETTPGAPAVICAEHALTYRQLDSRADRLAARLRRSGIGPESLVGIALPRTANLVVALLAVLKAGAGYVPIDPRYPTDRLGFLLSDASADLVLVDARTMTCLPSSDTLPPLLCTDDLTHTPHDSDLTAPAHGPAAPLPRPDNIAYLMYTSGSTGVPKGVAITHANVVNGVGRLAEIAGLEPGSRVLATTSVNFDVSVFEIFAALSTGAAVEIVRDVLALGEGGARSARVVHTVPSVFAEILDRFTAQVDVDVLMFAGEPLTADLVRQVHAALPDTTVVNAYGQTESFYATTHTVPRHVDGSRGVPIGRPLDHMRAYVLSRGLAPVPPGVPGELYISGSLARGYHARPALTAQRFVADPFGLPGQRMYRTGDLARWNHDGHLEHLGRADTQMKVRGIRIEPAEIEAVLAGHPGVAHAAVAVRPAGPQGRIVAYVVPCAHRTDGTDSTDAPAGAAADLPTPRKLRRHVADRLPSVMVPSTFVVLDRLPLAPNGKLDRTRLPAP
ncbi:non-ribosomal peptide synthetase [Streptomyces sp. WAC 04229]|uniref:non-ribosomal peptide synthetase n=1 Tax=Streptomyces sp. WAC 04229 TaxID=2203206 RepID=UPI003D703991